jgi:hypothetical protein
MKTTIGYHPRGYTGITAVNILPCNSFDRMIWIGFFGSQNPAPVIDDLTDICHGGIDWPAISSTVVILVPRIVSELYCWQTQAGSVASKELRALVRDVWS